MNAPLAQEEEERKDISLHNFLPQPGSQTRMERAQPASGSRPGARGTRLRGTVIQPPPAGAALVSAAPLPVNQKLIFLAQLWLLEVGSHTHSRRVPALDSCIVHVLPMDAKYGFACISGKV